MQDTIILAIGYESSSSYDNLKGDDDTPTLQLAASGSGWIIHSTLSRFCRLQM
jgi:hypothetical protein